MGLSFLIIILQSTADHFRNERSEFVRTKRGNNLKWYFG